jgi:hypothetical protein
MQYMNDQGPSVRRQPVFLEKNITIAVDHMSKVTAYYNTQGWDPPFIPQ